jgi:hypothetical protein
MYVRMCVYSHLPCMCVTLSGGSLVRAVRLYPRASSEKRVRENIETYRIMAPGTDVPE